MYSVYIEYSIHEVCSVEAEHYSTCLVKIAPALKPNPPSKPVTRALLRLGLGAAAQSQMVIKILSKKH